MTNHKKLVALTGAGISAESGIPTFISGYAGQYNVQEVASIDGWKKNPELVLHFYNERRKQLGEVEPNAAHRILAELEKDFDVTVITQNVDNLHERAGSAKVIHLHGELTKVRSSRHADLIFDIGYRSIQMGEQAPDGSQLRPHIVWFGEPVTMIEAAKATVAAADIFVVVGSALEVNPAAELVKYANVNAPIFLINPSEVKNQGRSMTVIREKATVGMEKLKKILTETENKTQIEPPDKEKTSNGNTYKNLTIFLIQGEDVLKRNYLTLEEVMKQKKITLHETGNVGELSVDNTSSDYVFIMAGDIVKGGRQDRTIGEDIVLEPGAKKVALKSFCVEQSRWGSRGSESDVKFSSSQYMLSNRHLKIAAREKRMQNDVWEEVSNYQTGASRQIKEEVRSRISPTSLQLTLEDDKVKGKISEYVEALQPVFEGKKDVLGFAFFINGKISTVETFGNAALFGKLQKKMLEAAASEAFELYDETLLFDAPSFAALQTFMERAEKGEESSRQTSTNMMEYTIKTEGSILLRSVNTDAGTAALHTSIYSTEGLSNSQNDPDYEYGGRQRNINRFRRKLFF